MAYKFQVGEARLSGSLVREGDVIFKDNLGSGIMLEVENDGDVNVYQHNGSSKGLRLGNTLVTSTAAELNLVDGSSAGTVVNSKGVIYSGAGQVNGTSLSSSTGITGSSLRMGDYGLTNAGALAISAMNANWTNAGRTVADAGILTTVDINGGSIDGAVIGANSAAAGTFAAIVGSSLSVGDGNITNVGDIALDTISADGTTIEVDMTDNTAEAFNIAEGATDYLKFDTTNGAELITFGVGWTAASQTCANLGTVTTVDINGGSMDGVTIGAASAAAATVSSLSVSDGNITNVGSIALDSISADDGSSFSMGSDWTNAGRTVADAGILTTVDINGGSIDGAVIGANSAAAGTFAAIVGSSLSVGDGNITNVGDIALDTISADGTTIEVDMTDNTAEAFNISQEATDYLTFDTTNGSELITVGVNWTAASQTCANLGTVTTADINGGSLDGVVIGAASAAAATVTSLVANGNVDLGDATSDTITATGRFDSALVPSTDSARDLGTSALRWSTIYVDSIVGADIAADTEKYGAAPLGYTLSASVDFALLSTAAQTYTLPAASAGKKLDIKLSGSIHTCTIVAGTDDSIEGGETIILESTGSAISLVAMDATHWFIV
jgi:hypothetical protein